jgi:hypothetical protein
MAFLRASALAFALPLLVALAACSDPADPPAPSDLGLDAGPADASANDAAMPDDATVPNDAATPDDAASPDDAAATDASATDAGATDAGATDAGATDAGATDAGPAPVCPPELGAACSGTTPCAATYDCANSRCVPQARPICGGFAGALCPGAGGGPATECLYFSGGSDYGPCFTPAERACICARAVPGFVCL